mmetsp:Transcript_9039/g.18093  ORF Transcript_9039/g.18093 Transcript_9039/m.18093 type:complete len:275 (-) Transcript_9039:167-991(-)
MGGLSLYSLAIRTHEHRGHQTQGTIALGNNVTLHITIVVLACPQDVAITLEYLSNHIVDQTVFVPEVGSLEALTELGIVHALECLHEQAIVTLHDGVLGRVDHRHVALEAVGEARASKRVNAFQRVVHAHAAPSRSGIMVHFHGLRLSSIIGSESHRERAWTIYNKVCCFVLVAKGMTPNHDGVGPSWHQARYIRANDGLTEHSATEVIADRAIWATPHLLQAKLLDACFVRRDGSTLHCNLVLGSGSCRLNRHLIVGRIAVGQTQIVVAKIHC